MPDWRNTVMSTAQRSEAVVCPNCGEEFGIESIVGILRREQAEITWKARDIEIEDAFLAGQKSVKHGERVNLQQIRDTARQKGIEEGLVRYAETFFESGHNAGRQEAIREVVEFIHSMLAKYDAQLFFEGEWQAFLKEKGIENG